RVLHARQPRRLWTGWLSGLGGDGPPASLHKCHGRAFAVSLIVVAMPPLSAAYANSSARVAASRCRSDWSSVFRRLLLAQLIWCDLASQPIPPNGGCATVGIP